MIVLLRNKDKPVIEVRITVPEGKTYVLALYSSSDAKNLIALGEATKELIIWLIIFGILILFFLLILFMRKSIVR